MLLELNYLMDSRFKMLNEIGKFLYKNESLSEGLTNIQVYELVRIVRDSEDEFKLDMEEAYDEGYIVGKDIGYDNGYEDGYEDGKKEGYQEGYDDTLYEIER